MFLFGKGVPPHKNNLVYCRNSKDCYKIIWGVAAVAVGLLGYNDASNFRETLDVIPIH